MKKVVVLLVAIIGLISTFANRANAQGLEGVVVERYYITDANDEANAIAQGAVSPLPVGSVAYRVYVDMAEGYKFSQLYGNTEHNLTVSTTTSFYNDPNYGVAVNPATISVNNSRKHTALIDSWFTTGGAAATKAGVMEEDDTDGTIGNLQNVLANNPGGCYGLPINGTDAQDGLVPSTTATYVVPNTLGLGSALNVIDQTNGNSIVISNGTIAALGGVVGPTASNRVLVAQFTTNGTLSFNFNLQLVNIATNEAENYVTFDPSASEYTHPTLSFISGVAPVVAITAPANGATLELGSTVVLQANATDNGGVIDHVDFYVDGNLIGSDATAPFTTDYIATGGSHSVYAIAFDNDCLSTQSSTINFNVISNIAPTITLSGPSSAIVGESIQYTAMAADADGSVAQVEFFINGNSVGIDAMAPYVLDWIATLGNNQLITAVVTDNIGASTTSNIINLNVLANQAPTVVLTSPSALTGYVAPELIMVAANASDADGNIVEVEFFVNGESIGSDISAPFEIAWNSVPGNATFYAVATDNLGLTTTSEVVSILVVDPNALPYYIGFENINCDENMVCLPIGVSSTLPIDNVIGLDISLSYDATQLQPTGNFTLVSNLMNANDVEVAFSTPTAGEILLSLFFVNGNEGMNEFSGVGELMCIEFERQPGFAPSDVSTVSYNSIQESYITGVQPSVGTSGEIVSEVNSSVMGNLVFWTDNAPLSYDENNPDDYLLTTILSANNGTINGAAATQVPDLNGEFAVDFADGNEIIIHRDINNMDAVQMLVNAADAVLAKTVVADGNFTPSIYQIMAMDVNLDGMVTAGDISQMQWRATSEIGEFMQAWNYDDQGVSNGEPSKDWVFIPTSELNDNPAYAISATYPNDDLTGYSKMRVPVADFNIPLQVENYSSDNSTCPMIENETYTSIMLGDVNGNYDGSDAGMETSDALAFNVDQALYTNELGTYYVEFPIVLSSVDENINAIDFWMQYDLSTLEFDEIVSSQSSVDVHAFFNSETEYLRVTASTTAIDQFATSNSQIFSIKFRLINPCELLSQDHFTSTEVLTNGIEAQSAYSFGANTSQIEVASNTVCSLANVDLSFGESVNSQNIISYDWNFGNGTNGILATEQTTYNGEGTYNIVLNVTTDAGCVFEYQTAMNVLPLPQVSFTSVIDLELLEANFTNQTFIVNSSISTYEWQFGDNNTSDLISPTHTYAAQGVYTVTLTAVSEDGCASSFTAPVEMISSVEETNDSSIISIYPNPSDDVLNIISNVNSKVFVLDNTGRIVMEMIQVFPNALNQINIHHLASGIYTINFVNEHEIKSLRFVRK